MPKGGCQTSLSLVLSINSGERQRAQATRPRLGRVSRGYHECMVTHIARVWMNGTLTVDVHPLEPAEARHDGLSGEMEREGGCHQGQKAVHLYRVVQHLAGHAHHSAIQGTSVHKKGTHFM